MTVTITLSEPLTNLLEQKAAWLQVPVEELATTLLTHDRQRLYTSAGPKGRKLVDPNRERTWMSRLRCARSYQRQL